MVVVVVASVTGVALLGVLGGATERAFHADPAYVWVFLVSMALSGVLCMWQSRLGERHREERTDPLTGCLNRRGFSERFDAELARTGREGGDVALIQLDLNGFKAVNDHHGHAGARRAQQPEADGPNMQDVGREHRQQRGGAAEEHGK